MRIHRKLAAMFGTLFIGLAVTSGPAATQSKGGLLGGGGILGTGVGGGGGVLGTGIGGGGGGVLGGGIGGGSGGGILGGGGLSLGGVSLGSSSGGGVAAGADAGGAGGLAATLGGTQDNAGFFSGAFDSGAGTFGANLGFGSGSLLSIAPNPDGGATASSNLGALNLGGLLGGLPGGLGNLNVNVGTNAPGSPGAPGAAGGSGGGGGGGGVAIGGYGSGSNEESLASWVRYCAAVLRNPAAHDRRTVANCRTLAQRLQEQQRNAARASNGRSFR